VELDDLPAHRELRRRRPPIRPIERKHDLATVGESHHDAGAASLAHVSYDRQCAADERVDRMGDDD
jgi:hypothetical protein